MSAADEKGEERELWRVRFGQEWRERMCLLLSR
jgi:hypothetical protein